MRAAFKPQCLHLSSFSRSSRSLTTRPRRVPKFTTAWDPTLPPKPSSNQSKLRLDYASFRADREALQQAQGKTVDAVIGRQHAIKRLDRFLALADAKKPESELRPQLWRAYALAKAHAPDILKTLPSWAWDILWNSQSIQAPRNRYCRAHVEELYHDMHSAGRSATVPQRVAYLESMFLNGKEEQALAEWEVGYTQADTGERLDFRPELLESGTKMHALAGNIDRARETMDELFDLYPTWNPAIMMTVFRAHTRSETEEHHYTAQRIYTRMKELLGSDATLRDYDCFFIGFLEARHLQYAKQVFRDTVTGGYLARNCTHEQIHKVLRRLHLFYRLGTDIAKATSIALHAIAVLPAPYHSHLFGDWMKLAVVQKAPEAAAQILDMMFKRGYEPQTYHFNLLLRALFRTKVSQHELKAENIGWRMVDQLAKSSPQSRARSAADAISKNKGLEVTRPQDTSWDRKVPRASVATFAILMQRHAKSSQWEHIEYLFRRMRELEILPNADIMNILMDKQCRQGNYNKVWEIFCSLTNVPGGQSGVFPTGASFRCLWKTLRLALGDHGTRENSTLPSPRQLLAENVRWWALIRSRFDAERFRIGIAAKDYGALNILIMHCFSYTKDLPGSLVAMHTLKRHFGIYPSDKAASVLQNHITWVDLHRETASVRSQYSHSNVHPRRVGQMGQIYHLIQDARFKRMKLTGDQYAYMSFEEQAELHLNTLSEFIRVVLKRQHPPEVIEGMIDEAKRDIGLPDLATGDMDAYAVA